jgi:hypothetical protein
MSDISDFVYSPAPPKMQDLFDIYLAISGKKNFDLPMDR